MTNTTDARMRTPEDFWGEPISIYTREQAIEDGVLVDVSDWAGPGPDGMLGGFRVPVVMTRALWWAVVTSTPTMRPGGGVWRVSVANPPEAERTMFSGWRASRHAGLPTPTVCLSWSS